jgi:hypothetical protein
MLFMNIVKATINKQFKPIFASFAFFAVKKKPAPQRTQRAQSLEKLSILCF